MGNKQTGHNRDQVDFSLDGVYTKKGDNQNFDSNSSGRSFVSLGSHQSSTHSLPRPWSRHSRRRWKESTLTLPYESSKTAWPVSQLESLFLPEFPFISNARNFELVEEVSKGAFGKVYKVKDVEKDQLCALKVLSKSKIVNENSVRQVKEEVHIQRVCGHHPFIVGATLHWQSRKRLYIVSDFVSGGELFKLLQAYVVLPIVLVRIYVAQLALALDFLHNAGVIYRDLKPENVLLDSSGNCQLTDFGLSKWLRYGHTTRTICGTPLYMAPEILAYQPYGHAADWWSLGVITCLMLTNKYPTTVTSGMDSADDAGAKAEPAMGMNGSSRGGDVMQQITKEKSTTRLPRNNELDVATRDLLLRLLEVDPTRRLRSLRMLQGVRFFKDFDFEEVKKRKVKPNDLLKEHFPNGPPVPKETETFYDAQDFDETFDTPL